MSKSDDNAVEPLTLQLIEGADEIRQNVRRFCNGIDQKLLRAGSLIKQTSYWCHDAELNLFGPAKFVGYRGMDFDRYEKAINGDYSGAVFDGHVTKQAIETAVNPFIESEILSQNLKNWIGLKLGENIVAGIKTQKWRFVELNSKRKYWAVVCNPDTYDGPAAVSQLKEMHWNLDRGNPQPGDRIIIWQAKGRRGRRGVIAMGEVTGPPDSYVETELEKGFWSTEQKDEDVLRTKFRIHQLPNLPIWESDYPELTSNLAAARAKGGTVFSLEQGQWNALFDLASNEEATLSAHRKQKATGQGFGLNAEDRKAVEMYAQGKAEHHFLEQGYEVADVSRTHSYDLHCWRGEDELRVEVKGTTGSGSSVFLTRNEVSHAREHADHVALFIVRNITIDRSGPKSVCTAGEVEIFNPWQIDQGTLEATQFEYRIPSK